MNTNKVAKMAAKTPTLDFQVAIEKCELCQEEDAQFYCNDCQEEMCSGCKTAHLRSKASSSHNVVSTKLGKSIGKNRQPIKCSTHSREIIRMYCNSCNEAVCVKCVTDINHENHKFEELETTLYRYQDEISQNISETKQQIEELKQLLHTIDVNVKDYTEVSDKTINEINQERKQIKSDVDKIADDLIDQFEKRKQQDLKLVEKEKKDIQKIISDHNEYLQSCEEKLKSNDFSNIQHYIKKPESNLLSITHINPPTFVSNATLNLQDMFGQLVDSLETKLTKKVPKHEKDQKKQTKSDDSVSCTSVTTISTDIVSTINPGVVSQCVSAVNDEAWCGTDKDLVLTDIHGIVKRKIQLNNNVFDMAVTTKGEIFVTEWNGTNIMKYLQDDSCINIADTQPYSTHGICLTSVQDEILVCLYNINSDGKVVRMTTAGQIKQTIQKDKQHMSLYEDPWFVAENINKDVVVVDSYYHYTTIVVVNKKGEYRYKYPDSPQKSHRISGCYGIACDNTGCILVSDKCNHRIHQIDMDGRFIKFILTQQHRVHNPRGLSIDNKGQLWLCNNNSKKVTIYKYRS